MWKLTAGKLLAVALVFSALATPAFAERMPSPLDGEAGKATMGCASRNTDDSYLCLVVRCDAPGQIGMHAYLTNVQLLGRFKLVIDGKSFAATGNADAATPYDHTVEAALDKILPAMKAGTRLVVDHPAGISPGYETVPLRGSSREIGRVETACVSARTARPVAEGLLRDAGGAVSIGGLSDNTDCPAAKGKGKVAEVQRGGAGGAIDGIWFEDENYGREFINIDALAATADAELRLRTLEYLLTPGRRLETTVLGCGAAGRVQHLSIATER